MVTIFLIFGHCVRLELHLAQIWSLLLILFFYNLGLKSPWQWGGNRVCNDKKLDYHFLKNGLLFLCELIHTWKNKSILFGDSLTPYNCKIYLTIIWWLHGILWQLKHQIWKFYTCPKMEKIAKINFFENFPFIFFSKSVASHTKPQWQIATYT